VEAAFQGSFFESNGMWYVSSQTLVEVTVRPELMSRMEISIDGTWLYFEGSVASFTVNGSDGLKNVTIRPFMGSYQIAEVELSLYLDSGCPNTSTKLGDPKQPHESLSIWFVTSHTPVMLNATDAGCGVSAIRYRIDKSSWVEVANSSVMLYLEGLEDGLHTIDYYAADFLENQEESKTLVLFLDNAPPTTSATFDEEALLLTLNATDAGCGTNTTFCRIVGVTEWQLYSNPINFSYYRPGTYIVEFYSVDHLGNQEDVKSFVVKISQPETTTASVPLAAMLVGMVIAIVIVAVAFRKRI